MATQRGVTMPLKVGEDQHSEAVYAKDPLYVTVPQSLPSAPSLGDTLPSLLCMRPPPGLTKPVLEEVGSTFLRAARSLPTSGIMIQPQTSPEVTGWCRNANMWLVTPGDLEADMMRLCGEWFKDSTMDDDCSFLERQRAYRARRRRSCPLVIATQLKSLEAEDADCVLFARRINKLGYDSATVLKKHYEQYGPVKRVLLSNPNEVPAGSNISIRHRPSGLGFVVMERAEDAKKALAQGKVQVVRGVAILQRGFERRPPQQDQQDDGFYNSDPEGEQNQVDIEDLADTIEGQMAYSAHIPMCSKPRAETA